METSLESLVTMGVSTRPKPSYTFAFISGALLNLFANASTPSSYVFQFQPASRCRPSWSTSPSPPRPRTGCTFSGTSALAARLKDWGDQGEWLRQVNMKTSTEVFNANCQPRNFHFYNSKNCWWCGEHTWLWWLLNQLTSTAEKNQQLCTWSHLDLYLDMFFMHFKIWEQLQIFWLGAPGRRLGALLEDQLPCCATLTGSTRFNYIITY